MTITTHDGIALLPKRCNKCHRLFIFEAYDFYYRPMLTGTITLIKCKECIQKERQCKNNDKAVE
jgi:hypothetical protein